MHVNIYIYIYIHIIRISGPGHWWLVWPSTRQRALSELGLGCSPQPFWSPGVGVPSAHLGVAPRRVASAFGCSLAVPAPGDPWEESMCRLYSVPPFGSQGPPPIGPPDGPMCYLVSRAEATATVDQHIVMDAINLSSIVHANMVEKEVSARIAPSICICTFYTFSCMQLPTRTHMHKCTRRYAYMHTCMYIHAHTYTQPCTYTYGRASVHTQILTRVHTYIHT